MASLTRRLILYLLALLAAVYSLLPLYNVFGVSLMNGAEMVGRNLFPPAPSPHNFLQLFGVLPFAEARQVKLGVVNSVIAALSVTSITMVAALPGGYSLGRLRLRGRDGILWLVMGTRTVPPFAILLPCFLYFRTLNLWGTMPGLVLLQLSLVVPIVTWVLAGFFRALPTDIEMCARVDGCTRFQAFRLVLLPLAAPGIAASAVIAFLFSWNDYLYSLVLTSGTPAQTLNAIVTALDGPTLAAGTVFQVAVAIVLGGFLQRYITSLKIIDPGTVRL